MFGLPIDEWPLWAVMWLLAFSIYSVLKLLSWVARPPGRVPAWKHAGYLFAWPGMDAAAFLMTDPAAVYRPAPREWTAAAVKMAVGVAMVVWAGHAPLSLGMTVVGWIGMIGTVLALHFGLFHLLSCAWRTVGVNAVPIMQAPLAATGVSDFWSRRWNLAFRDLTHRFIVRPLRRPVGASGAVAIGFLVSGLVHDLVISFPARGGFGWPTVYFMLQGAAVFAERSSLGRALGLGRGMVGRLFAWVVVAGPAPLLLHRPFVHGVMAPFISWVGELV